MPSDIHFDLPGVSSVDDSLRSSSNSISSRRGSYAFFRLGVKDPGTHAPSSTEVRKLSILSGSRIRFRRASAISAVHCARSSSVHDSSKPVKVRRRANNKVCAFRHFLTKVSTKEWRQIGNGAHPGTLFSRLLISVFFFLLMSFMW